MHRSEYMAAAGTESAAKAHRKYYGQFVTDRIKTLVLQNISRKKLLASTDPHLNDIPLRLWDNIVSTRLITSDIARQLKECGDWLSLGTGVCILKEAARQIIEDQKGK